MKTHNQNTLTFSRANSSLRVFQIGAMSAVILFMAHVIAQEAPANTSTPQPGSPAKSKPAAEPELLTEAKSYERKLRELAEQAQAIVGKMPEKAEELSKNFTNMRGVLEESRKTLQQILDKKPDLDAQAAAVLKSAATVKQAFLDETKRIADRVDQLRRKASDNPQAVENAAQALLGIQKASERGQTAVAPLRDLVLETQKKQEQIFAELSFYPDVFDSAITVCGLYEKGLGDPANYAAVVESLWKARESLRAVIYAFMQAAQQAEEAVKKMPTIPNGPATPLPHLPTGPLTVPVPSAKSL